MPRFDPSASAQLGVVERGRVLSRAFEIENEGDTTCTIESIRARRESPEVAITPSAGSIPPGEKLVITVELGATRDYDNTIDVTMTTGEQLEIGVSASSARSSSRSSPSTKGRTRDTSRSGGRWRTER